MLSIRHLARSFWITLFPLLSTLIAPALLVYLEQGRELLNAITDEQVSIRYERLPDLLHYALFVVSLYGWGFANWYSSRLLLDRHYQEKLVGNAANTALLKWWFKAWPRVLGAGGIAVIAAYLIFTRHQYLAGIFAAIWIAPFLTFLIKRRNWFGLPAHGDKDPTPLRPGDWIALGIAMSLSLVLLISLAEANYTFARFLGAPVILFLGLGSLVMFGSIVLTYLPLAYGLPSLVWVPLVLAFLFASWTWNRNHGLDSRLMAPREFSTETRPDVVTHFKAWARSRPEDSRFVLVAAEGGASRAGWWAGHVLAVLDYASKGQFSNQTYALSSVSGGSLGTSAFVTLLAHRGPGYDGNAVIAPSFPSAEQCRDLRAHGETYPMPMQLECMLGSDYLSTTLGYLLFPDLLQRFLPFPVDHWDRSLGLEQSWKRDWSYYFRTTRRESNPYAASLVTIYQDDTTHRLPLLLLNSARSKAGRSVIQAPVTIASAELDDLFGVILNDDKSLNVHLTPNTRDLPLSAVVHNSARFPLISPGGDVHTLDGTHWDSLIDAGYFEGSGAATIAELLRALRRSADGNNDTELAAYLERIDVLFIMNGPTDKTSVMDETRRLYGPQAVIRQEELLTPVIGLYSARTGRSDSSKRFVVEVLSGGKEAATEVFLSLGDLRDIKPSMSWYMNPESRRAMWAAVSSARNSAALCRILERVTHDATECANRVAQFKAPGGNP